MNPIHTSQLPTVSVVIASPDERRSVAACLHGMENQTARPQEVIIVDDSSDGAARIAGSRIDGLKVVRAPKDALVPELWALGIEHSRGDIIAITTTHFVPAPNWIERILKAHEGPYAGIGGAIENDPRAGLVSWAVYFCRYSSYMPPFSETLVNDFAADNASYKRWALDKRRIAEGGFWEAFVHQAMRKAGLQLFVTPEIIVAHQQSFGLAAFLRQRFRHGMEFGVRRAESFTTLQRVAFTLASPLIPAVLFSRITRRILKKRRHAAHYILASPVVALFLLSWSLGEVCGYMSMRLEQETLPHRS